MSETERCLEQAMYIASSSYSASIHAMNAMPLEDDDCEAEDEIRYALAS